tara:strand:+ start:1056 stop:1229 length:174 start_codon:yes stop_codon:yes gene_type:complete
MKREKSLEKERKMVKKTRGRRRQRTATTSQRRQRAARIAVSREPPLHWRGGRADRRC